MTARPLYRLYFACLTIATVISYEPVPRWGQAAVVINNVLFVHGGKTDQYNSYGYTSAPNNHDILCLSLSSSFTVSSPPWQLLSNASSYPSSATSPALSWHTLSAFDSTHLLLFGGEPDPSSPTALTGAADSAYLVDLHNLLEPWIPAPVAWAGEPMRRVHHSATATNVGNVYIIGGERADNSGIAFSENYIFDPIKPSFALLPSDNAPLGITGHASVVLSDERILVLGGYSQASAGLSQFSTIWTLDNSQPSSFWSMASVSNVSLPSPRRAFAATTISNGRVLIHGGSDASLQTNFEDGWILDTSRDPMVWTQVEALSQLGPLRDHLAVSSGNQVIFSFGYGNDKPSPITMRIFNTNTGAFESVFTPPSNPSVPTQTFADPSRIPKQSEPTGSSSQHSSSAASPTKTTGPNSGDPAGGNTDGANQDSKLEIIGIAVGSALGLLSFMVVAVAIVYYIKRRQRRADGGRHFRALGETVDYYDDESEHLAGSIPAAGSYHGRTFRSHHRWDFDVFDTAELAVTFGFGTRIPKHVTPRKDMLADEDTSDFTLYHSNGNQEGTVNRAWSLRSLIPSLKSSREPSLAGSMGNISWREKHDTSVDDAVQTIEGEVARVETPRLHERSQRSYTNQKSYHDPFADPLQENVDDDHDERGRVTNQTYHHPTPHQPSSLRTILPVSQDRDVLNPLTESLSHNTLNETSNCVSVSSHATSQNNPFATISSIASHTSFDLPPKSLLSLSSTVGTSNFVKRSDSWWSRFAKTGFLDRQSSNASKNTFHFRDPNPPPRLDAIQEGTRTGPIDRQPADSSDETRPLNRVTGHVLMLQGNHSKSQSSVRTADTEAIEKMARTMDVAHLMRSDSRHAASTSTTDLSIALRPRTWLHEARSVDTDPEQSFTSMTYVETYSHQGHHHQSADSTSSDVPIVYPPTFCPEYGRAPESERRGYSDSESMSQIQLHPKQRGIVQPVQYGLIPRATLFVANPDNERLSS